MILAEADEEMSFVMAAVESDVSTLVPTQRLWSRINDAIEEERTKVSFWHRVYAGLTSLMAGPSLAAAAVVLVLFGFFAFIFIPGGGLDNARNQVAAVPQQAAPVNLPSQAVTPTQNTVPAASDIAEANPDTTVPAAVQPKAEPARAIQASYRPEQAARPSGGDFRPVNALYVPGEDSYLNTIETLKASYDSQKDRVLSPSSRVAFERDLAVVDNSIKQMREVVRKNPNNQAARQVLYSSYQDKIDLLNSVGQKEELLASLQ
jgi:hypothetical protein